jgi:hypothetical protein
VASSRTSGPPASPARRVLLAAVAAVLTATASVLLNVAAAAASEARSAAPIFVAAARDSGPAASAAADASHGLGTGSSGLSQPLADRPCPLPTTTRFVSSPPPGGHPDWLLSTDQVELCAARDPHSRHAADAGRRRSLGLRPTSSTGDTRPAQRSPRPDPAAVLRVPGRDPPSAA